MRRALLILLFFNAFTAIVGGLGLVFGWIDMSAVEIHSTLLSHLVVPGAILVAIVGGSALWAGIAFLQHAHHAALIALVSGIVMEIWLVSEMYLVAQFSWIQIVYLLIGLAIMILSAEYIIRHLDKQTNHG